MEMKVSDLKQWFYCPRVVYWTYCLPVEKKLSFKMELGAQQHEVLSALERRRSLKAYQLQQAERHFHVPLYSESLGLSGVLDLLLITPQGRYLPVEFKQTTGALAMNHRYQLAGYALLLEETYGTTVDYAYLYRIPLKQVSRIALSPSLKDQARRALGDMRAMIEAERLPYPTPQRAKCEDCEYRRYCGDVW
ncbi:MAG: CRISPR-associated protein Cas4 [Fimbriimonadia bacterium]|nr:CRISPR-associated protein Cas4 [Fimbriimonadia bacterium]